MITIKVKPISFDDERTDTLTIDNEQEFWDFRRVKYPRDDDDFQRRLLVNTEVKDLTSRQFMCGSDSLGQSVVRHIKDICAIHYIHNLVR